MERGISLSSVDRSVLESNPVRQTFWELHRQLAECYVQDTTDGIAASADLGYRNRHLTVPEKGEKKFSYDGARSPPLLALNIRTLLDEHYVGGGSKEEAEADDQDSVPLVDLKPYPCFKGSVREKSMISQRRTVSADFLGTATALTAATETNMQKRRALHPGGQFRTGWNLAVAICVLHDLIFVPLEVFEIPPTLVMKLMEWVTQIFWNMDFFVALCTGFYRKGALVLEPWPSAWNYAKTWMPFDLALISLDWVIVGISAADDTEVAQWTQTLTMLRFLRLARMLRWVKLQRVNEVFQELLHSQAASLYYSLVGSIARLLILNHLTACGWFLVGRLNGDEGWQANVEGSGGSLYLKSMNWAFAQLSVGSSPILPTTDTELVFSCIIAFRSLITYSTLISTMTSLMTGLSKIKEDEATEFRLLRNYLVHNDIPKGLQQKIVRFLQNQYSLRQQALSVGSKVPLLDLLSQQLTGELHLERYRKHFLKLGFLRKLAFSDDFQVVQVLQKVAQSAVHDVMFAAKDVVFLGGGVATAAHLKMSGSLVYYCAQQKEEIDDSTWLAEACLWTNWMYMGNLVAEDSSLLTCIDSASFGDIICSSITTQKAAVMYAKDFLLQVKRRGRLTDFFREEDPDPLAERRTSIVPASFANVASLVKTRRPWNCFRSKVGPAEPQDFAGVQVG